MTQRRDDIDWQHAHGIAQVELSKTKTEIERLRVALKPFVEFAAFVEKEHPGWYHPTFYWNVGKHEMTMAPFIKARAALNGAEQLAFKEHPETGGIYRDDDQMAPREKFKS